MVGVSTSQVDQARRRCFSRFLFKYLDAYMQISIVISEYIIWICILYEVYSFAHVSLYFSWGRHKRKGNINI